MEFFHIVHEIQVIIFVVGVFLNVIGIWSHFDFCMSATKKSGASSGSGMMGQG